MLTPTMGKGKYGSDLIVDLMQRYDIPYVALNPGSTFRGLHDSIVNYGGNKPEEDPKAIAPALQRAMKEVQAGRPALVDTVTQFD